MHMFKGDNIASDVIGFVLALAGTVGTLLQGLGAVGVRASDDTTKQASARCTPASVPVWGVAISTALGVGGAAMVTSSVRRYGRRKRTANRVVSVLHQRWFPNADGYTLNESYRVSLWCPQPNANNPKKWCCMAASLDNDLAKKLVWPVWTPGTIDKPGIIALTAYAKVGAVVDGVPLSARKIPTRTEKYCVDAFLTQEQAKAQSWPYASLITRVASWRAGVIECIAMVEQKDGEAIVFAKDPDGLSKVDLVAAIWSETMGGRA